MIIILQPLVKGIVYLIRKLYYKNRFYNAKSKAVHSKAVEMLVKINIIEGIDKQLKEMRNDITFEIDVEA